jgi:alpha-tubulin suppressor-like RCC1 family protein
MSKRWLGGIVSGTAPTITGPLDGDGGSAPGVWSMEQAQNLNAAGTWPKPKIVGTLYGWGYGGSGVLGATISGFVSRPGQQIGFGTEGIQVGNWLSVSAGYNNTVAIKTNGTLWTWGYNTQGQLGINDTANRSSPVQVGSGTTWASVSFGSDSSGGTGHIVAIKTDGTLWSWGYNTYGALGLSDTANRSSPVQVGSLTNWASVSAGNSHTAAIKTDGTLWTWGSNGDGQLGLNTAPSSGLSPRQVGSLTNWASVSAGSGTTAGSGFTAAIKTDGTLWTWGQYQNGKLGTNQNYTHMSSPVQVGSLTNWSKVSAGVDHAAAIKTDGTLWTWGLNNAGQLGLNDVGGYTYRSSPVQVASGTTWSKVSAGNIYTVAIKTDGTLWAWGYGGNGQLGQNNNTANISSPTQVGTLTTWTSVSAGCKGTDGIKTDGTLWAWGYNAYGTLGQNNTTSRSSPVQVGSTIPAYNNDTAILWSSVAAGQNSGAAIKSNGTLWMWGKNDYGQLGQNNLTYRSSPTQVGSLTTWSSVYNSGSVTFAIKTDGTLWAWGYGGSGLGYGALGQGNTDDRSSPTQIGSLTTWSTVSISAGSATSALGIAANGKLYAWGGNSYGQLGLNDQSYRLLPVQVGALTTWSKVSAGYSHSAGIKTDGTLWAWGNGYYGGLGNNDGGSLNYRSSPIQVGALTTWSSVSVGQYFTTAIKTNGTLWVWGYSGSGAGGQSSLVNTSSPIQVGALTNWLSVYAGPNNIFALKTDGTLWAWGPNGASGVIGDGNTASRSSPVQIGTATDWVSVAFGTTFTTGTKTNGSRWAWGDDIYGRLGNDKNNTAPILSPVQVGGTPSVTAWNRISNGSTHSHGIKVDGTLWAWGVNSSGRLGLNDVTYRSSPTQVGSGTTWAFVSASYNHTAAIKTDGTLWTWGSNISFGQLGLNDAVGRSSPTQVGSGTTWAYVTTGWYTTAAIKTDGTLWTWGSNDSGQLGLNLTGGYRSSPTQVGSLTNWLSVSASYGHIAAIKTDGSLWIWGAEDGYGQLGLGTNATRRSSPTQVGSLTNWAKVSCGFNRTFAIKTDGTLWTWGWNNSYCPLGLGDQITRSSPTQIGALTNWFSVSSSYSSGIGLKTNGTLWAWGNNRYSQLGLGTLTYADGAADTTYDMYSSPTQVGSSTKWARIPTVTPGSGVDAFYIAISA